MSLLAQNTINRNTYFEQIWKINKSNKTGLDMLTSLNKIRQTQGLPKLSVKDYKSYLSPQIADDVILNLMSNFWIKSLDQDGKGDEGIEQHIEKHFGKDGINFKSGADKLGQAFGSKLLTWLKGLGTEGPQTQNGE